MNFSDVWGCETPKGRPCSPCEVQRRKVFDLALLDCVRLHDLPLTMDAVGDANELTPDQLNLKVGDTTAFDAFTRVASGTLVAVHTVLSLRVDPLTVACADEHWRIRMFDSSAIPRFFLEYGKIESLFVLVLSDGTLEGAVMVRPLKLERQPSRGRMPRLRNNGQSLQVMPVTGLIEPVTALRPFAAPVPELPLANEHCTRTVPRRLPAGRNWLARHDGALLLVPFGARPRRCAPEELRHEYTDGSSGSDSD